MLGNLVKDPEVLYLVLTHDVDWPRHGPPRIHVLARLHRFDLWTRYRFFYGENLYDGIRKIVECEERFGIKSTFFFRPAYDDGSTAELYSDVMHELDRCGWEIGLHANDGRCLEAVAREKEFLERVVGARIVSMRVHYLAIDPSIVPRLEEIGILVDSSLCFSKHGPDPRSVGVMRFGNVVELPITVMDTYLFTYWRVEPSRVVEVVIDVLRSAWMRGAGVATLLWHSNAVEMVGGREYVKLLEELWRYEWIRFVRARDVLDLLEVVDRGAG